MGLLPSATKQSIQYLERELLIAAAAGQPALGSSAPPELQGGGGWCKAEQKLLACLQSSACSCAPRMLRVPWGPGWLQQGHGTGLELCPAACGLLGCCRVTGGALLGGLEGLTSDLAYGCWWWGDVPAGAGQLSPLQPSPGRSHTILSCFFSC